MIKQNGKTISTLIMIGFLKLNEDFSLRLHICGGCDFNHFANEITLSNCSAVNKIILNLKLFCLK